MVLPEQEEMRAAVKFCFSLGYSATQTYENMQKVPHTQGMKKRTVFKWFKRFKDGRASIGDDKRSGRPTVTTPTSIASVKTLIENDRRRTVQDVVDETCIAFGTVWNILHDHLHMRRISARWVPRLLNDFDKERRVAASRHFLQRLRREGDAFLNKIITCDETWIPLFDPETKQESSQWVDGATPRPVKAKVSRSAAKYMFIMFADSRGMILCHTVPHGKTVNSEYYSKVLRRDLQNAIRKKRPGTDLGDYLLHQDNAPPHVSEITRLEMSLLDLETVPHPAYSPDLAPMDFCIFPEVKSRLRGNRYNGLQELRQAVQGIIADYNESWYRNVFSTWVHRHQRCVEVHGDFIEKL